QQGISPLPKGAQLCLSDRTLASVLSREAAVYGLGILYFTPVALCAKPLEAMIRTSGFKALNATITAGPSITGMVMSVITAAISRGRCAYLATASAPFAATNTR